MDARPSGRRLRAPPRPLPWQQRACRSEAERQWWRMRWVALGTVVLAASLQWIHPWTALLVALVVVAVTSRVPATAYPRLWTYEGTPADATDHGSPALPPDQDVAPAPDSDADDPWSTLRPPPLVPGARSKAPAPTTAPMTPEWGPLLAPPAPPRTLQSDLLDMAAAVPPAAVCPAPYRANQSDSVTAIKACRKAFLDQTQVPPQRDEQAAKLWRRHVDVDLKPPTDPDLGVGGPSRDTFLRALRAQPNAKYGSIFRRSQEPLELPDAMQFKVPFVASRAVFPVEADRVSKAVPKWPVYYGGHALDAVK